MDRINRWLCVYNERMINLNYKKKKTHPSPREDFINVSLPVKWVFYGSFEYSETFGELGGHYIRGKQLVYLSELNEILSIACSFDHSVA